MDQSGVRRWAREHKLVKEIRPTHYFTNFTLTMLVICYLQTVGMLPTYSQLSDLATESDSFTTRDGVNVSFLHNINNQKELLNRCYHSDISLQDLLHGFFSYYATYDFSKNVLCPITGTNKMKTKRWKHSSHLDLVNPLEPSLNISYNVGYKGLEQFKDECRKSIKKLNILKQASLEESPVKDGLFWIFKNETAPPQRPRLVIPSLRSLDLGSGKDNLGGKKSRSETEGKRHAQISVKEYFELSSSSNDTQPRLKINKTDGEKSRTDETINAWKNETESGVWSEINQLQGKEDNMAKSSKLLSKKKLNSLFKPSIVEDSVVSTETKVETDELQERERLERLKMKYLRNPSSQSFKHNL